jgi:hypothetical protein
MKNFVKENWYKLMIGSSMMMASFGFMIYAISPTYANEIKTEEKTLSNTNSPNDQNYWYLVDSQDRVWYQENGWSAGDWYFSGKTLK